MLVAAGEGAERYSYGDDGIDQRACSRPWRVASTRRPKSRLLAWLWNKAGWSALTGNPMPSTDEWRASQAE